MDLFRKRISPEVDGASVVSGSKSAKFRAVDDFDDEGDASAAGAAADPGARSETGKDSASVAGSSQTSVAASAAGMSRISRLTSSKVSSGGAKVSTTTVGEQEKAAFSHACPNIHTDACKAIQLFTKASAVQCGAPETKAYYCFVLKLTKTLHSWAAKVKRDTKLGDVARQLGAYPVLAYHILSDQTLHEDPVRRIVELVNVLDAQLPCTDRKVSIACRTECTRLAARAVIPFAFGLRRLVPNPRLDFLLKQIERGELKAVRYSLAFVIKGKGDGDEDEDDDTESSDSEEDEEAGAGKGAGAAAAAAVDEAVPAPLPSKNVPQLKDELTEGAFMAILESVPHTHTFELLQSFGMHNPGSSDPIPYATTHDAQLRDKIMRGDPVVPPCRGSILRAYVRSVLEINVDSYEADIQTVSDCILLSSNSNTNPTTP